MAIAILEGGLVCAVGLTARSSCAAMRAGIANFRQTRFPDSSCAFVHGAAIDEVAAFAGRRRLLEMASLAAVDCLRAAGVTAGSGSTPLLLCVAELERPGRVGGLDGDLLAELQARLGLRFDERTSALIAEGRPSVLTALAHARRLIDEQGVRRVLIVASDSLLNYATLGEYDCAGRLLSDRNSNGFVPGEAAAALLVGPAEGGADSVVIGFGRAHESAALDSEEPLRADGLRHAFREALAEAHCAVDEFDFVVSDVAGEQYYFKEAALALARLRAGNERFEHWHPADCIGNVGAAAGAALVLFARAAWRGGHAPGATALLHAGSDAGTRVAIVLRGTASD